MATSFFTADQHFGHENIIKHCHRPFSSLGDMDSKMANKWNEVVNPKDTVYILGDFLWGRESVGILDMLKGHKVLVMGGHDEMRIKQTREKYEVVYEHWAKRWVGDIKFFMCHYPFSSWPGKGSGYYHLHGHSHCAIGKFATMLDRMDKKLDVGVDGHDFYPWSADEIVEYFKNETGGVE